MSQLTKNIIALRNFAVNLPAASSKQDNLRLAMSVNHQLMTYGYMLTEDALEMVKSADSADIIQFHNECVNWLKEMTGGSLEFNSLYGNFPNDILSKTRAELFADQIAHYWGKKTFDPAGKPKDVAFEHTTYKMISATDDEGFMKIFTDLCSVNQSLTPQDQDVIKWFATSGLDLKFPETIPFKENLTLLVTLVPTFTVKTVTDVLRVAVGFSGGDVSLPALPKRKSWTVKPYYGGYRSKTYNNDDLREKFKFNLTKEQGHRIMELFEGSNLDVREMNTTRRYGRFIRLFERLPMDKLKYPKTCDAAYRLRNQRKVGKIVTFNSQVTEALLNDPVQGIELLATRPGEFVRKLDWLVRKFDIEIVLNQLAKVAEKVSNKVLFEVYTHFENRRNPVTDRSIMIKGARKRTKLPDLPEIAPEIVESIQATVLSAIKGKFALLEKMGNVWIDPELKKIPMPTNMRSLSESLVPIIRGQRIPIGNTKKTIRAFVHWNDKYGNEDIDLHGFLFGGEKVAQFGYNGVYSANTGTYSANIGTYSGDIRHRTGACAEYIDINVQEALKQGFSYYVMVVHNFQSRPLATMDQCFAGFMERDNAVSNKSWLPETVANCMRLTSAATMCLVGVIDLETREYIHLDLDWATFSGYVSKNNSNELFDAFKPYITAPKISLYDLFSWHVEARGGLMVNGDNLPADTLTFTYDDFKYSYAKALTFLGV